MFDINLVSGSEMSLNSKIEQCALKRGANLNSRVTTFYYLNVQFSTITTPKVMRHTKKHESVAHKQEKRHSKETLRSWTHYIKTLNQLNMFK